MKSLFRATIEPMDLNAASAAMLRVIFAFCLAIIAAASAAAPFDLPPAQSGANLDDCHAKLVAQGGGWCEIRVPGEHPSISSVWPQDLDQRTRMIVGPRAVLQAWNGAAFDEENLLFYFMGGGHADYGGNEVYEFDLKTGRWSRLTDPSPLSFLSRAAEETETQPAKYCWTPDMRQVPGATHTYDGVQFSKKTGTIFQVSMGAANGSCFADNAGAFREDPRVLPGQAFGRGVFEFNPDRETARNGLEPLTWRRIPVPSDTRLGYPRSLQLPDGSMMLGSRALLYPFDPTSGEVGGLRWKEADFGDGTAIYHPPSQVVSLHGGALLIRSLLTDAFERVPVPGFHGKSLAVDGEGVIFSWSGGNRIVTLDLGELFRKWRIYDWSAAGPAAGDPRVYSKWQYIRTHDVFVGLTTHATGVWIYKHPAAMPGDVFASLDPQRLIQEASPDSVVTIPPGLYGRGLVIDKSLTVKLKDVRLWGVAAGKGLINVRCDGCAVTIEDFHGNGRQSGCLGGNCAGIKAEGVDFQLTVKRAHIDNTVMGILTDNRGGRLVIEDSVIDNTGLNDNSRTLAHGVYAGSIDQLIIRDSVIRNVNGKGHILKSRARETVLEGTSLLGEHGVHSRAIDMPCGGTFRMTNSVIQHGANSDNEDVIALGTEPNSCPAVPSEATIADSWIVIDRAPGTDRNILFRWRAPMAGITMTNNHIVNLGRWSSNARESGDVEIADLSPMNTVCRDRGACGLGPDQVPIP